MGKKKSRKFDIKKILVDKRVMIPGIALFASIILYFGAFGVLNIVYGDKVFPGTKVAGLDIGGLSEGEAKDALKKEVDELYAKGFEIKEGVNTYPVKAEGIGLSYDIEGTVKKALEKNKMNYNLLDLVGSKTDIEYKVDEEKTKVAIKEVLAKTNELAAEAQVKFEGSAVVFTDEKDGFGVAFLDVRDGLTNSIRELKAEVLVEKGVLKTTITKDYLESHREDIEKVLADNLKLTSGDKTFELKKEELAGWLNFDESDTPATSGDKSAESIEITLNKDKVATFVTSLAGKINMASRNAQLTVTDGKVSTFALSQDGKTLDVEGSVEAILKNIGKSDTVELVVATTKAEVNEDSISSLGLKELVGRGYSSFAGSPKNRIHNINTGASKFVGVLIKPGEDFSFNKALGPVDASTGFLPELVILQNKTTPEFGGGLCQVSSTAFRAALNSGLPITARKNHSYPVSYYKPYGVDATIYLPYPDLKFTNDTNYHILIQTYIKDSQLYFDFYGTKPARTVKFAGDENATGAVEIVEKVNPAIFNNGGKGPGSFDAQFYRFIYASDGSLKTRNKFFSSYDSPDKYPH